MAVSIESEEWSPRSLSYLFLFASCFASLFLFPHFSKTRAATPASSSSSSSSSSSPFDLGPSAPFLRFQRRFLLLYSLSSVVEGLGSVTWEYQYAYSGLSREHMALCLAAGAAAALFFGTLAGVLSDIMGPRKACFLFCFLHLAMGVLKSVSRHPSISIISLCLALASSIFSFCFESWMVTEHEEQGHRQDLLGDTFWLMTFYGSASLVGSQGLANLLAKDLHKGLLSPSTLAALLVVINIHYISKEGNGCQQKFAVGNYKKSFVGHIVKDKKIWLLAWAQASIHFSILVFWILWAPTIVADGREVNLSQIYPCFLGSRMLGSTAFPWFFGGASSSLHNEDSLTAAFVIAGLALLIVAYDYQEIGVLVILFCIFHTCVGLILPSLARLRTMYVPNELRGSMISLSLAPANAAVLFILIQGGFQRKLGNAAIMALSAFGMLTAAGCIHVLRWWRKHHPHQNWHKL